MYFNPTLSPKDTSLNVRTFIKEHKTEFWTLVRLVLPYLCVLVPISMYLTFVVGLEMAEVVRSYPEPKTLQEVMDFTSFLIKSAYFKPLNLLAILVNIAIAYCFAVIAISWHRLVLLGPENCAPMSILSPQKHELQFVMMLMLISVVFPNILFNFFHIGFVFLISILSFYVFFRISFYFPAKAVDANISLSDSFKLTKGYFGKFFFSMIRAFFRVALVYLAVSFLVGMISGVVTMYLFQDQITSEFVRGFYNQTVNQPLLMIPLFFYFQPVFTVLAVTILSNYYQHALQNKREAQNLVV